LAVSFAEITHGLAKEEVQEDGHCAEDKKYRQEKPLAHSVLHRVAVHGLLSIGMGLVLKLPNYFI
jgi:hypothetical protein